jgi:RNA polymerase sigma factor (sigma-70 family)
MTTAAPNLTILPATTDADLVSASRSGDRKAFGQIVCRYQAMISGLIYAACGDLHRSEDIAQDTFISAWKSLSGLRDATKLPGWLCQIARRRLADAARKPAATEIPFGDAFALDDKASAATVDPPTAEECEFLWRTLSEIPQPYRETLVLFYRQEQSTAQVAAAMETTEANVRQRLARGREMLREEMAAQLERNLARSAPGGKFTMQVVAALPILTAQATGVGVTAKGAAVFKAGSFFTALLAWLAPIGCAFGLVYGTVQDMKNSGSPRQRNVAKWMGISQFLLIVGWVVAFNILLRIAKAQGWTFSNAMTAYSIATCLFGMLFFTFVVVGRRKQERLFRDESFTEKPFPNLALWQRMVFTLPVVAIFLGWMIQVALKAGDQLSVEIVAAIILVESLVYARRLPQLQPTRPIQQTFEVFTLALIAIVAMCNWKLRAWVAVANGLDMGRMDELLPLTSFNLCAGVLFVWMAALTAWSGGSRLHAKEQIPSLP